MTTLLNPDEKDFHSSDALRIAKNVAWVIKTLWGAAVVFAVAIAWGVSLANDVKANTEHAKDAPTKEQIELILVGISDIKESIDDADERQREIKSQLDKLESKVDTIEKRDE